MKPNVRKALFVFGSCAKRGYPRGTLSNDRKVKQTRMYGVMGSVIVFCLRRLIAV